MRRSFFEGYVCRLFFVCLLSVVFLSCGSRNRDFSFSDLFTPSIFDEEDFSAALQSAYSGKKVDTTLSKDEVDKPAKILHYVYYKSAYLPLWITETGNTDLAEALLKDIESLRLDGLDPATYNIAALEKQMAQLKDTKEPAMNAIIAFDTACTMAYLKAAHDLKFGVLDPKNVDDQWFHGNDTSWNPGAPLVSKLSDVGEYPDLKQFRSKIPTYGLLLKAKERYQNLAKDEGLKNAKAGIAAGEGNDSLIAYVAAKELGTEEGSADSLLALYQQYFGLNPTGKADEATLAVLARQPQETIGVIHANLERLRWLPTEFDKDYVLVNVPLMELFLRRSGKNIMHMNVVVGKPARRTPTLGSKMNHIVFNPPWGVPPTILKEDVIPGMERSGEAYLDKKDLQIFDRKGNPVDPSIVNASNYEDYVFRQPPGDDNALGLIKFNMPNRWNIYLHDTPNRSDFKRRQRAKSSGCIRVEQPQEMAMYILNELNGEGFNQEKVNGILSTRKTKYEKLSNEIPVHIVYLTAFEDDSNRQIRFVEDIYDLDAKLISMLPQSNNAATYVKR